MADYGSLGTKLLKITYDKDRMQSLVNEFFDLEKLFPKFDQAPQGDVGSQKWVFACLTRWPNSVTFQPYSGYIRTADGFDLVNGEVTVRQLTATGSIEYAIMKMSMGQPRAFRAALELERETLVKRIRERRLKAYFTGSSGIQAYAGTPTGAVVPVFSAYGLRDGAGNHTVPAGHIFRIGDKIVFHDGTDYYPAAPSQKHFTIVGVSDTAITLDASPGAVAGYGILFGEYDATKGYVADYGNAMNGFADLLNGSVAYEGIDPATVPQWAPLRLTSGIPGNPEPLDGDIMNDLFTEPEVHGFKPDTILFHTNAKAAFYNMFADYIRYQPGEFKGGMSKVSWDLLGNTATIWFDPLFPKKCALAFPAKDLMKFVLDEGDWLRDDGGELKWVTNKTSFVFVWAELRNVGTRLRNHFLLRQDLDF